MNTTPWWYSGDDDADADAPPTAPRLDPSALIAAAGQLVDWATDRIVTPHAEHTDPAEHPTCVLCRSAGVLHALGVDAGEGVAATISHQSAKNVRWIPVTDQRGDAWA